MTAGRPTTLDKELLLKIKALVLEGNNMKKIAEAVGVSYRTMEGWKLRNYEGFADKMLEFRLERMFEKSVTNIEVLQSSEDERVNLQANTLVAETIGKKFFSKRTELTGKDGEKLFDIQPEEKEMINSALSNLQ